MSSRQKFIIIAIGIIATLWLPLFSLPAEALAKEGDAFFEETGVLLNSFFADTIEFVTKTIQRQHSMLSLSAKTLMAKAESNLREQIAGIHRMLGAKSIQHSMSNARVGHRMSNAVTETKNFVLRNLESATLVKHLVFDKKVQ